MSEFCHTCNANENAVRMRGPDECEACAVKRERREAAIERLVDAPERAGGTRQPPRVVVCGSRDWDCEDTIRAFLSKLPTGTRIAHGSARGADELAAEVACQLGFQVAAYPADWAKHGKAAGAIRNREMLKAEQPRRVIAFVLTPGGNITPGSLDCITAAACMGIAATVVPKGARP